MSGVTGPKKTRPTTGVELRFYKYKECTALTDAQREELHELHPKGKGSDGTCKFGKGKGKSNTPTKGNNYWTKKQIKGEVAALFKEQLKKKEDGKDRPDKRNPTKGNNHWTKKQTKGEVAAIVKEPLKKKSAGYQSLIPTSGVFSSPSSSVFQFFEGHACQNTMN